MSSILSFLTDHLRRIRTNETDRSLVELTGDRDVFLNLHKYFVFLLKAGGQRIVEVVLEGPPPVMARAEPVRTSSISGPEEDMQTLDRPVSAPEFSVVTGESTMESTKKLASICYLWHLF